MVNEPLTHVNGDVSMIDVLAALREGVAETRQVRDEARFLLLEVDFRGRFYRLAKERGF